MKEPVMRHRLGALLLFVLPIAARAQEPPEHLLPAGTQLYLRWDGVVAHRTAYAGTALGKMLAGDTGRFLAGLVRQFQQVSGILMTSEQLLQGVPPERLQQLQAEAAQAPQLLGLLARQGFVLGIEVRSIEPPDAQLTLIVPDTGTKPGPLFGTLHLAASLLKAEVAETIEKKAEGQTIYHVAAGPVHLGWWAEGKHAVVVLGTEPPEIVRRRMQGTGPRLTDHALFKRVHSFRDFETGARAFLDVAALVRLAQGRGKGVEKLVTDLGLDGLRSVTLYSGFDGAAERSLSELELSGPRRGLLRMLGGKGFTLANLPPVAPDAVSWSATNFDAGIAYDTGVQVVESIFALLSPDDVPKVRAFLKQVDEALGIDVRKDLLEALGDRFAQYTSPAEGPLTFGQTILFRVRDEKKVEGAVEQALKSLAKLLGKDITLKRTTYRGVTLTEVHVRQEGFILVPSFAAHNGWLAVSFYPQPVQGFVLRSTGELPAWKPDAHAREALDKLPRQFVSIAVSDPRPTLRQLLALAPLAGGAIRSFAPEAKVDVGAIPNAHEATRHLFPNVTVVSDDGRLLRSETRASLALPIELSGVDLYAFFFAFAAVRG
jgi:hypothetical protein